MLTAAPASLANEPLTIAQLLADPHPYHMKIIRLQGLSYQVQSLRDAPSPLPRLNFQCYFLHPPYTFVLGDDTGFLQIMVRGRPPCVSKESPAEPPEVVEGMKLSVDVQITVAEPAGDGGRNVSALAVDIQKLDP